MALDCRYATGYSDIVDEQTSEHLVDVVQSAYNFADDRGRDVEAVVEVALNAAGYATLPTHDHERDEGLVAVVRVGDEVVGVWSVHQCLWWTEVMA